jgi:hypothetical protein
MQLQKKTNIFIKGNLLLFKDTKASVVFILKNWSGSMQWPVPFIVDPKQEFEYCDAILMHAKSSQPVFVRCACFDRTKYELI